MTVRSTTTKRILREAADLTTSPSPDFHAAPLGSNLYEWHFTLRGPPSPSPFANGLYHGRITLPSTYPLRPPSFRFLTPSGRFEVNREICLSISRFHEESWQPAWGIRTALVAIRSFMDGGEEGAVGGMTAGEEVRRTWAGKSATWKCAECGRSNGEIMGEHLREYEVVERERSEKGEEVVVEKVPEELRLGYKDQLGKEGGDGKQTAGENTAGVVDSSESAKGKEIATAGETDMSSSAEGQGSASIRTPRAIPAQMAVKPSQIPQSSSPEIHTPVSSQEANGTRPQTASAAPQSMGTTTQPTRTMSQAQMAVARRSADTGWLDKAIIGVAGALAFMVLRVLFF